MATGHFRGFLCRRKDACCTAPTPNVLPLLHTQLTCKYPFRSLSSSAPTKHPHKSGRVMFCWLSPRRRDCAPAVNPNAVPSPNASQSPAPCAHTARTYGTRHAPRYNITCNETIHHGCASVVLTTALAHSLRPARIHTPKVLLGAYVHEV
jgi:hypothetical protein